MERSGKTLMVSGGALAVLVAGLVSALLARQPATTAVLPGPHVGAAGAQGQQSAQQNMTPVLIAVQRIPRGTVVHAGDVARLFRRVYEPAAVVATRTVFTDPSELIALLSVMARATTMEIEAGDQISAPLFSGMALPVGDASSLAARLPRGRDGETVNIPSVVNAVEGAIHVNDRVDVVYSTPATPGKDGAPGYTGILIQDATVIATGPLSTTYTLALAPRDAVRLARVKDAGWSLHLLLRSIYDGTALSTSPASYPPKASRSHAKPGPRRGRAGASR